MMHTSTHPLLTVLVLVGFHATCGYIAWLALSRVQAIDEVAREAQAILRGEAGSGGGSGKRRKESRREARRAAAERRKGMNGRGRKG